MLSLVHLPVEVLDVIFAPLPAHTLAALARTNEHLNPSASRLLYRHVSLSSVTRNLSAVSTLASRPHLSSLVRTFAITVEDGAEGIDSGYYTQLSQALNDMKGLSTLEVHIDARLSWILPKPAPSKCPSPLEHFACSFGLDKHVARFLSSTPSLRSLQLASSPAWVDLPQSVIPNLTTYTGPPNLLAQLLPSRRLTSLHLSEDLSLADIEHFAQTTDAPTKPIPAARRHPPFPRTGIVANTTIETLSTITSAEPVAVIEALGQFCPNLVSLQVIATCAFWQTLDMAFYARIGSALSLMPRLLSFELSGMHWEFRPKSTLTADGICVEKEWISPPVTPRHGGVELDTNNDLDFEEAFMEWAY
ncbi:hypothetical protein BDW22DRAFT_514537 [Trametopsis cervina]|nr:hypothetical protein BDW22DRAFT_514537 [Trametopsis cervina]